ncbi:MAG: ATP cone domain-containing protein [Patescibacteria group bacterium]
MITSRHQHPTIFVTKEDGSKEEFVSEKLEKSLVASGANPNIAEKITHDIIAEILAESSFEHTTSEIYKRGFRHLKESSHVAAAQYSLRRSLMEFGPTGFPFEDYIAEVFKSRGYSTMTGQVVFGSCVPHEIDVVAWNKEKLLMAEVKYHNEAAGKTDLKVALYVKARYDDLKQNLYEYGLEEGQSRKLDEGWLITNTKLTETAITYANCVGIKLMSWDYPEKGNLRELIVAAKLHPVTCLTTLSQAEKAMLMKREIVLCKTIYDNKEVLKDIGFNELKIFKTIEEISEIMKYNPS